jgi:hypothetical protein
MMRRALLLLVLTALAVAIVMPSAPVRAAAPVAVTSASQSRVEVGQRFTVSLTVSSDEPLGAVSSPSLAAPPGVLVEGPSTSMSTQTRVVNGVRTTTSSARITFSLTVERPGKVTIPSPTAVVGGAQMSGRAIEVEVIGAGGALAGPGGLGGGALQLLPRSPFDFDDSLPDDDSASAKALAMETGPDDVIFLRAIPDKTSAYVGEQITLSVYLYYRVEYEMTERGDARYNDFLRYPLLLDPSSSVPVYTRVGARRYGARLVEKVALVPLRSGKLKTGAMTARFNGRRIGARVQKRSNEVDIEVVEPPADGRPAHYTIGDVGQFSLTAAVTPRKVQQGGSIGVVIRVEGTGNLPSNVRAPEQKGAEWLAPRSRESISTKGGKIGGWRSFEYVVRLKSSGRIDLGSVELPYFDPDAKRYEVVSVGLGEVEVEEAAPTPEEIARARASDAGGDDPLSRLPEPRKALSTFQRPRPPHVPTLHLALALAAAPLFAVAVWAIARGRVAVRRRKGAAGSELRSKAKEAISQAKRAEKGGAWKEAFTDLERAIQCWIEARTGVRARALRLGEVVPRLSEAGLPADLATEAHALLEECENQRFVPAIEGDRVRDLLRRTVAFGKKLDA